MFSVVIPLFNKQAHVTACIESVLSQTFKDFEIILVDDGSQDASASLVERIGDPRIRLHRQSNQGVSAARNVGVDLARSETIFFLDADDTWDPSFLEEMVALISSSPSAGVWGCGTRKIYAGGAVSYAPIASSFFQTGTSLLRDYFETFLAYGSSPFSNSSYGLLRSKFREAGGYTPGVRLTEDSALWCRLTAVSDFAFLNKPLANYHVETDGNTRSAYQLEDYEVITTLTRMLSNGALKRDQIASATRLLVYQKLSQIKRLILVGKGLAAIRRLLDTAIWRHQPSQALMLSLLAALPFWAIRLARKLQSSGR